MDISQKAVNAAAQTAIATIRASQAVAVQVAAQVAAERGGAVHSGPAATLIGSDVVVAP